MYNNIKVKLNEDMVNQITGEIIIREGRELSLDSITGILKVVQVYDVYDIQVQLMEPLNNPMKDERVVLPGEVLTVYELNQIRHAIHHLTEIEELEQQAEEEYRLIEGDWNQWVQQQAMKEDYAREYEENIERIRGPHKPEYCGLNLPCAHDEDHECGACPYRDLSI